MKLLHVCYSALSVAIMLTMSACGSVRMIECDSQNEDGSHIRITNQERLFNGGYFRMCEYIGTDKKTVYGIELDLYDNVKQARKGNLFTIELENGKVITLKNLFDSQAEVTTQVDNTPQTNYYTDFVPVYDAWVDAVYSVPVHGRYYSSRSSVRTETAIKLYYLITPEQLDMIEKNEVQSIKIVGDDETLDRRPGKMSEQLRALDLLIRGGKEK